MTWFEVWMPMERESTGERHMFRAPVQADDPRGAAHRAMSQAIDQGMSPQLLGPPIVRLGAFGEGGAVEMGPFDDGGPNDGGVREPRRPKDPPPHLTMDLPEP
jgi:hypothetical protein